MQSGESSDDRTDDLHTPFQTLWDFDQGKSAVDPTPLWSTFYKDLPIINHLVPSKKDLPMILNGQPCRTCADFGASSNIIDARFAKSIGLRIDKRARCPSFRLPIQGRKVVPVGKVSVPCMFPGEPDTISTQTFFAIQNFVYDAIMGRPFLRETQTLDVYRHRLQDRPIRLHDVPVVALLGSVEETLRFWLDGEELQSTPDTGSEVNVMSYAFAKSRFFIEPDDIHQVRFADGSLSDVEGRVSVPVSFGNGEPPALLLKLVNLHAPSSSTVQAPTPDSTGRIEYGKTASILAEFYVVRNLRADIIFGEDLLATVNAFVRHSTDFDEIVSSNGLGTIGLVERAGRSFLKALGKAPPKRIDPAWELDNADSRENDRYWEEQKRINTLSGQERVDAQRRNDEERREYNDVRSNLAAALAAENSRR
ncbi:hypothetical protein BKA64DRAFT_476299 [Cadophora sp. MPI-SDFR-AT-0126]|nr:hypothetical protein BKA64DRAFT_476299 [Leotiomycetes sp. MPI-SDFR-AT-0126]